MKLVKNLRSPEFNHAKITVSAFLISVLAAACAKPEGESTTSHDHGEPTRVSSSLLWFSDEEKSLDDYREQMAARGMVVMKHEDAPTVSNWAKYWIDGIDTKLREKYPQKLAGTPKPQVALIRTANPNAFISADYGCVSFQTLAKESGITAFSGENPGIILMSDQGPFLYPLSDIAPLGIGCEDHSTAGVQKYIRHFNEKTKTGCFFELAKTQSQANVSGCVIPSGNPEQDIDHVVGMLLPRVNPFVNLNLGLIDLISDEDAYISILAHELGHYYRAHSSKVDGEYDYTYVVSGLSRIANKPSPAADS